MDPGTIALGTMGIITGISGYGASKTIGKDQSQIVEQLVRERIAETEGRLKNTQDALKVCEDFKASHDAQIAALEKELEILRRARPAPSIPPSLPAPEPVAPEPAVPEPVVPEPAVPEPAVPEPAVPEPAVPEPEANFADEQPEETAQRDASCKKVLEENNVKSNRDFKRWSLRNHPDQGGDEEVFKNVSGCVTRMYRKGGLRKKKLRTRRGGKQKNVRRTRGRKNRTNRTHSNSR